MFVIWTRGLQKFRGGFLTRAINNRLGVFFASLHATQNIAHNKRRAALWHGYFVQTNSAGHSIQDALRLQLHHRRGLFSLIDKFSQRHSCDRGGDTARQRDADNRITFFKINSLQKTNRIFHNIFRHQLDVRQISIASDHRSIKSRLQRRGGIGAIDHLFNGGVFGRHARPKFGAQFHNALGLKNADISHWIWPKWIQARTERLLTGLAGNAPKDGSNAAHSFLHCLKATE